MQEVLSKIFVGNKWIWRLFATISICSLILMYSAISSSAYMYYSKGQDYLGPFMRHVVFMIIGWIGAIVISRINYNHLRMLWRILLPLGIIMCLLLFRFGEDINGASRSIRILGISFQPFELVKFAGILALSDRLARHQTPDNPFTLKEFIIIMITLVGIMGIIAIQNLSTALIIGIITAIMMLIGRVPFKYLMLTYGVLGLLGVLLGTALLLLPDNALRGVGRAVTHKHRVERMIADYTTPTEDKTFNIITDGSENDNSQIMHSKIAVARGVTPAGPGNSKQRTYLSLAFSDFIFAILIEEYGIYGAIFVIFLYVMIILIAINISLKSNAPYPSLLAIGFSTLITLQAAISMAVATGLGPVTGQPLPLFSLGGTSMIMTCAYFGFLISASRFVDDGTKTENKNKTDTAEDNSTIVVNVEDMKSEINQ